MTRLIVSCVAVIAGAQIGNLAQSDALGILLIGTLLFIVASWRNV